MRQDFLWSILKYPAAMLCGAWIMTFFCEPKHKDPASGNNTDIQLDSVKIQIDTSTAVAPEPAEIRPRDTVYIKVYLAAPSVPAPEDSVLYLPVLLEQKVYEDSTYRAVVSGPSIEQYGPRLDSISVYSRQTTVYQTKTVYVEPSRWSVGVQAGYGASKDGLTPYIGIGVQYNIWSPKRRRAPP